MTKFQRLTAFLPALALLLALTACAPAAPAPSPSETAPAADSLLALLSGLTEADIGYVSWYGPNEPPSAEEMARLLRDAAAHPVEHGDLTLNGSATDIVWSMDVYLGPKDQGGYAGDDDLYLFAGLEENVVEIFGGASLPEGRIHLEDEALYQRLRTMCDTEQYINDTWYERYREEVDGYYDARLEELRESGYASWELTEFAGILGTTKENGVGATAFRMAAAFRTDPPDRAPFLLAGGAYVDSQLRVHGLDWQSTYLVDLDGEFLGFAHGDGILQALEDLWGTEDSQVLREALASFAESPGALGQGDHVLPEPGPIWGEQVFQRDYAGEESHADTPEGVTVSLRFVMPRIENAGDNAVWQHLNDEFAAQGEEWLQKGREYWGTPGLEPGGDYAVESAYTVQQCGGLLSLRYERTERLAGAPAVTVSGATFDLETGDAISMEALFRVPVEEFRPVLLDELGGEESYRHGFDRYGFDRAHYEDFLTVDGFYLTETDLILLFPIWEGEATSPSSTLERPVPLTQLKEILTPALAGYL